jgi:glutamyl-tRNA reductase
MAEKFMGHAFSLEFIKEALINSKCIISCTGSPDYIIQSDIINNIHSKTDFPELIIDMAVPRDINTRGLSHEVEVFDLEGLSRYLEKEKRDIILDIPDAERIIENESNLFEAWNEAQYDSTFSMLNEKIESVRLQLLNELKYQLPEDEFKRLDKFSRSLAHRMKSTITQAVKIDLDNAGIYKTG